MVPRNVDTGHLLTGLFNAMVDNHRIAYRLHLLESMKFWCKRVMMSSQLSVLGYGIVIERFHMMVAI